jgi:hypothetical protein
MRAGGVRVILSRPNMKKGLGSVAIVLLEMFFQVAEGAEAAVLYLPIQRSAISWIGTGFRK